MNILFVDDDEKVLAMFRRNLGHRFQVETSSDPEKALEQVRKETFAVVVADLRMPRLDGFAFLAQVSEISPLTVKIMLTGHADLDVAIAGVNEGRLFRFLTKPCPTETLIRSLEAALEQYRLVTAEKELLRGTLQGSIKVLTEILGQTNPEAFGRSERIKRLVRKLAQRLGIKDTWRIELAAMLSQIGCIFIPEEVVKKKRCMDGLSPEELQVYSQHPAVGAQLLSNIPRLEEVREMIEHQDERLSNRPDMSRGARMLKICLDYDNLEGCQPGKYDIFTELKRREGWYDKHILDVFERMACEDEGYIQQEIPLSGLREGMILAENLYTPAGILLLAKGLEVSLYSIMRLRNLVETHGVKQPFKVLVAIG